ncbi:MAG TPA: heat-inducible transcriptional repressor HrcA [Chloroflexota bacterium]|nr:heat-inducible transcriptional repressor HrcA [Chloroflexota bacterium]
MDVSSRRQRMLKHVVEDYVRTAVPVSSDAIVRRYEPTYSRATIRNELAQLEELGLISHPHTSAGRVPTDTGYRFYVEHLMETTVPTPGEQRTIRHQFHQVEPDIDRWAHLASTVLANAVPATAVVTPPTSARARVLRVTLVQVHESVVLITALLHSGAVRQQVLHVQDGSERDDLDRIGNQLTRLLDGRTADEVARLAQGLSGVERQAADVIARIVEQADQQTFDDIYYEGLGHVLSQPEFTYSHKALPLIQVLERGPVLGQLLSQALDARSVLVVIGAEHPLEQMRDTSAVLTRYGVVDEVEGVLGVLGPTRMPYWRAVAMVRFMASLMDLLVAESLIEGRSRNVGESHAT